MCTFCKLNILIYYKAENLISIILITLRLRHVIVKKKNECKMNVRLASRTFMS